MELLLAALPHKWDECENNGAIDDSIELTLIQKTCQAK